MGQDWGSLPDRPSPPAVDNATKQLSTENSLSKRAAALSFANHTSRTRILLPFPTKGTVRTPREQAGAKRVRSTTIEPLRGSYASGDEASIEQILARSEPRRIQHNRRSTWIEEFLVQWGPEHCTFGEALEQYNLGFDIESITSLEDAVSSQDLLPFVAAKRPTRTQRRDLRRQPLTTACVVQFAPSPQGPLHIRSIAGGPQALDIFLEMEPLPSPILPTKVATSERSTPIKWSSSAQAPTRAKLRAVAPPSPLRGGTNKAGIPRHSQFASPGAHTVTSSR